MNDADNSHFGKKRYMEIGDLLREEWEQQDIKKYTDLNGLKKILTSLLSTIVFLPVMRWIIGNRERIKI